MLRNLGIKAPRLEDLSQVDPAILASIHALLTSNDRWLGMPDDLLFSEFRERGCPGEPDKYRRLCEEVKCLLDRAKFDVDMPDAALLRSIVRLLAADEPNELLVERARIDVAEFFADFSRQKPSENRSSSADHGGESTEVIVIGAGFSGLAMARRLVEHGFTFKVLEKTNDVGGVWAQNRYPDCGLDSPPALYSLNGKPYVEWSRPDPKRAEILGYAREYAQHHRLTSHVIYGVEVLDLRFDAGAQGWDIRVRHRDGELEIFRARFVVTAVGTLHQPKFPNISGLDSFQGEIVHTATWDSTEYRDRKIGLIGNGSSGVQVLKPLAAEAENVTVFQRSPAWISPRTELPGPSEAVLARLDQTVWGHAVLRRIGLYWTAGDKSFDTLRIDHGWPGVGPNQDNDNIRIELETYIREQLRGDEKLAVKLTPDYPPYVKRVVFDNDWYTTLLAENVSLTTSPITRADSRGLQTADGHHHDLDLLVCATGFYGDRFLWPMNISGRSGHPIHELTGVEELRAYLGVALVDLPNLWTIQGPNSSIGHGGGATWVIDSQAEYIASLLEIARSKDIGILEVREDFVASYNDELDRGLQDMVWSFPGVASRYRNSSGRIVANHPWTLLEYWRRTRNVSLEPYLVERKTTQYRSTHQRMNQGVLK